MAQQTGAIYHQGILYSGGSGTNVTPNPQGEATDTLNTVEIDGTIYDIEGGGGTILVDSAIDESRCLFESTEITKFNQTPVTYTATEDCYAICIFKGSTGTNMRPIINGKAISFIALNDMISTILPLKKGDVISNRYDEVSENCYFKMFIYGRKPASIISAPVIYSDEERRIGVWRDNKPLYQKTKIFPNTIAFSNDTVLDMEISNVDTIFVEEGYFYDFYGNAIGKLPYSQDGNLAYTMSVKVDISNKSHLKISSNTTFGVNSDRYIAVTVRYTKTTDVAGSGEYNTLAIPNVHYSTDEQVIGTWIDGKTLYQRTWQTTAVTGRVVDLSGVNVEKVIYQDAFIMSSDGNNITPHGGESFVIWNRTATSSANPNNCIMCTISNSSYNNGTMYVTLQYTKTTD